MMLLIKMSYFVKIQIKSYLAFWFDPDLSRDFTIFQHAQKYSEHKKLSFGTTKPIIGIFLLKLVTRKHAKNDDFEFIEKSRVSNQIYVMRKYFSLEFITFSVK